MVQKWETSLGTGYFNFAVHWTFKLPPYFPWTPTLQQHFHVLYFIHYGTRLFSDTRSYNNTLLYKTLDSWTKSELNLCFTVVSKYTRVFRCSTNTHSKSYTNNTKRCMIWKYKVVQIWPGQTVTCLRTNSPGHIWTTLYINLVSCSCVIKNGNTVLCTKLYWENVVGERERKNYIKLPRCCLCLLCSRQGHIHMECCAGHQNPVYLHIFYNNNSSKKLHPVRVQLQYLIHISNSHDFKSMLSHHIIYMNPTNYYLNTPHSLEGAKIVDPCT
jgi:hypothetical protein